MVINLSVRQALGGTNLLGVDSAKAPLWDWWRASGFLQDRARPISHMPVCPGQGQLYSFLIMFVSTWTRESGDYTPHTIILWFGSLWQWCCTEVALSKSWVWGQWELCANVSHDGGLKTHASICSFKKFHTKIEIAIVLLHHCLQ